MKTVLTKLFEIHEMWKAQDPLLKRGIQRGWVCVINPQMAGLLMNAHPEFFPFTLAGLPSSTLNSMTGRITYVLERAPRDDIEYMSEDELIRRYPEAMGKRGHPTRYPVSQFMWRVRCTCSGGYRGIVGFEKCDYCGGSSVRFHIYCKAYDIPRLRCLRWRKQKVK